MMDELISRRDTISAMEGTDWYHINSDGQLVHGANSNEDEPLYRAEDVYKVLNDMPSAQPEKRTEERTGTHACDLISRQAAIEAHYEYCNKHPDAGFPVWSLKILEDLPSAQPERQKGEWIDYTEDGYVECPFCHSATNCDGNKDELHFCFSCGADMREDAEEPKKCDTCLHEKEQWFSRCADCSDYELWESKDET